jgi:uncharacterized protein YqgC (DUF456 family)
VRALTLLAVGVDYLAGALGAKKMGATKWGVLGAVVGMVPGIFFGLPGMILGPSIGAIAFEYWKNPDFKAASKAGAGVMIGFAIGIVAKCALALAILGVAALAYVVD